MRIAIASVAFWVVSTLVAEGTPKTLRGSVVDEWDRPIAGAVLCPEWGIGQNGVLAPLGPSATTDASGQFSVEIIPGFTVSKGRIALLAFDPSRNLGAFIENEEQQWTQPKIIRLKPVHQVRYATTIEASPSGRLTTVQVYSQTDSVPVPLLPGNSGAIDLPPGMYELRVSAPNTIPGKEKFTVENSDVNLPPLKLKVELSPMTRHYGLGTPRLSSVVDLDHRSLDIGPLKGHWTFLYFWADWCVPCIAEGIPKVNAFVLSHRDQKSQFRVIAVHRNGTDESGDWNDFREKTLKLEKSVWHFVPAFPVAFDETTRMTSDWGIHEVPSSALIDPDGNLIRDGSLEILAKELDRASPAVSHP